MTHTAPRHATNDFFSVANDQLMLGNMPLSQLAQRVGQTPFYAYDRNALTARVKELRQSMPADLKIHYAMKANPMPAVVQHMATLVDGFDLASTGEMKVALDTTMPAAQISFAGPGKRCLELQQAIAAGVTINIESARELEAIAGQCAILGLNAKVAVRINPAFELKASGMKMGGGAKQFGIDEERVPTVLQRINSLGLDFQGFHIYSGSQNLKAEAIIEAQQKSLQLAAALSEYCPAPIRKLNIGGGFGIPYFPGDTPLDLARVSEALAQEMEVIKKRLPEAEVIIELGRYLVGEAGVYVTSIVDKKESRGQIFLVTDGGLHHHLAASGNFGQVIRKNYPVAIGNKMDGQELETVNIVGPLCTPLDILADKMKLPKADVGDLVVVYQSGAYGYTASPTKFLSQPDAVEVLV
ncbi:MAG: pyridoxal-dependent decarboxylase, exosortase A system-associated [Methylomonas sp.]